MKRHFSSLFIAIIVHIFIMALLFSSYYYISSSQNEQVKEAYMCVQISSVTKPKEIKKKILRKNRVKKVLKKAQKKKILKEKIIETKSAKEVKKVEDELVEEVLEETPQVVKKVIEKVIATSIMEKSPEKKYIDENIDKIIQLLQENLYYPRSARKRGITGEVIVRFTLLEDSSVRDIIIVSSKREILSRAAQRTIEKLSGEFPKPSEMMVLHIPIMYSLVN